MAKRLLSILLAVILCGVSICSCNNGGNGENDSGVSSDVPALGDDVPEVDFTVALVTDPGEIDTMQALVFLRDGISEFTDETGAEFFISAASKADDSSRERALTYAIEDGADVIVAFGMFYAEIISDICDIYPHITFLVIATDTSYIGKNVSCLFFREEEAGFLAGYAAVMEGYRHLGFFGSPFSSIVGRSGCGFVQGADYAAKTLGVTDEVSVRYEYDEIAAYSDALTEEIGTWYSEGVELIFTAGSTVCRSVADAALRSDGAVIGFDIDRSEESGVYLTSTVKNYDAIVYFALSRIFENSGKLPDEMAGKRVRIGVEADSIGLSDIDGSSGFVKFRAADYDEILTKMKNGEIYIDDTALESYMPPVEINVYGENADDGETDDIEEGDDADEINDTEET